jgi:regulatory protein
MARRGREPSPLQPEAARGYALRALGRREHSARELEHKLARAGLDETAADEVVQELGEAGWQSDARYAGLLVRSRISQGYGPLRISAELSSRGIDAALIHSALAETEPDWSSVIRKVYERRYDAAPESAKERASRYRFLAARGFTSDQIRAVMQGLAEDD